MDFEELMQKLTGEGEQQKQTELRDKFAMAALGLWGLFSGEPQEVAKAAYRIADAMLEARKKENADEQSE